MNQRVIKAYAARMTRQRRESNPDAAPATLEEAASEMVRIIQHVARVVAPAFRFGYHRVEDIEQQGVCEALEAIEAEKYDVSRPLENFLYTHIRNRLSNFRRNHYQRLEPPCRCCDPFQPPDHPCKKWRDWSRRNAAKQNLMRPLNIAAIADESESNMKDGGNVEGDVLRNELRSLLDRELPVDLRKDYLLLLSGATVPKGRRQKVREAILEITRDRGYFDGYESN